MAYLNTVMGPIHPEEIGVTAVHEHIMAGASGWAYDTDFWFDTGKVFRKCYDELMDFKLLGGQTYVDGSAIGMGRDIDVYVKLANSINQLNIVASTGFGKNDEVAPHFRGKSLDYFEELFVHELTEGMGNTRIKAGIISVANGSKEFTKLEEAIYRAAARAAKRTGAAIITNGSDLALTQLKILTSEKLDPSRIIISHLDDGECINIERDKQIARSGAYVAYDFIGVQVWSRPPYVSDERRVELVIAMLNSKFKDRILLSTDSKCHQLSWGEITLHNVGHLLRYFLPKLKQAGVDEDTINGMLIQNPKRVLPIQ